MTNVAVGPSGRLPKPMNPWRLEWTRMTRTPRAIALASIYLFFGLLGPVTAKYLQNILSRFQSGIQITVASPTPKDGIANYVSQVSQTGLIIVVVISAGALAFDARRGLSTFLRTRAAGMWQLLAPRLAVSTAIAVTAYTLGTLAAWYETTLLIGSPPAGSILAGLLCGSVYLIFAVSVTSAAASIARTTLGTIGIALAALAALPMIGLAGPLHAWLPSTLVTAPVSLLTGAGLAGYIPALGVAAGGSALLVTAAAVRLGHRDN